MNVNLPTTLGVEIELNNQAGVNADINALTRDVAEFEGWIVKRDGSCGISGAGPEIISPILKTVKDLSQVFAICYKLKRLGYQTNSRCGLHIHLGAKSEGGSVARWVARYIKFAAKNENLFFGLAPTRSGNTYCSRFDSRLKSVYASSHGSLDSWESRYYWINGQSYSRHTTLENRLMSGTINPNSIVGWALFNLYLVSKFSNETTNNGAELYQLGAPANLSTLNELLDASGVADAEVASDFSLHQFVQENMSGRGTIGEDRLAQASKHYLVNRWNDIRNDAPSVRARRRELLHSSWKGAAVFEPMFVRLNAAYADV